MYADLPAQLREVVKEHLLADDFQTAKKIHDEWMRQYSIKATIPQGINYQKDKF